MPTLRLRRISNPVLKYVTLSAKCQLGDHVAGDCDHFRFVDLLHSGVGTPRAASAAGKTGHFFNIPVGFANKTGLFIGHAGEVADTHASIGGAS